MSKKEGSIFFVVGIFTVLLDYVIYQLLMLNDFLDVPLSKGLGFIGGTVFSFFANRAWTFKNTEPLHKSVPRFCFLYLLTLSINVIFNSIMLNLVAGITMAGQIAFVFATLISAGVNFLGMKFFVFNKKNL